MQCGLLLREKTRSPPVGRAMERPMATRTMHWNHRLKPMSKQQQRLLHRTTVLNQINLSMALLLLHLRPPAAHHPPSATV